MAAEPISVRLLRTEVMRWLAQQGIREDRLAAAVALATSEAVANVVVHAYRDGRGRVELDAEIQGEELVVTVRDRGSGLAPQVRPDGKGIGLPLIGRVADGVMVVSDEGGTNLTMRFELPQPARLAGSAGRHRIGRAFAAHAH